MIAFIDGRRGAHGAEPIRKALRIAPSARRARAARRADPAKASARARRDAALRPEIRRVFGANSGVYGVRKAWRQLRREGEPVARCTVARLMRRMGPRGVARGKGTRTAVPGKGAPPCPADLVDRRFRAPRPNALRVSDSTCAAIWQGFVYAAFVIDALARRVVGWRASRAAHAGFALDALERALRDRRPMQGGLVHRSDRGGRHVSMRYTERPAEAGTEPSVGSVGDPYDDALAGAAIGLFKAEVIRRRGPWRSPEAVEFAALDRVDWFNTRRLLEPIGSVPPAEAEERYHARLEEPAPAAWPHQTTSGKPGAVQRWPPCGPRRPPKGARWGC